jgi:hypothetical protein
VILDGWRKENLAILREDGEYARLGKNGRSDHLRHHLLLNHATGPEALKSAERYKSQIEGSRVLKREFRSHFETKVNKGDKPPKYRLWNAETVFHADFRKQAGKALRKNAKKSSPAKDAGIRGAKSEAPGIIASAKEMFPQPKSKGKKDLFAYFGLLRALNSWKRGRRNHVRQSHNFFSQQSTGQFLEILRDTPEPSDRNLAGRFGLHCRRESPFRHPARLHIGRRAGRHGSPTR